MGNVWIRPIGYSVRFSIIRLVQTRIDGRRIKAIIALSIAVIWCVCHSCWAGNSVPIQWEQLSGLNNETGVVPRELSDILQQPVTIEGFIVPIELADDVESVSEFILVSNPLACLHVPPPPPNQMIYVEMNEAIPLDMDKRGVAITGHLSIPQPIADQGGHSYRLKGVKATPANISVDDDLFDDLLAP